MRAFERGTTTVEFAICGAVLLAMMLAVIEFGRALLTFSVLNEGARRATRVAAVCAPGNAGIAAAAQFFTLPGAAPNVAVEYYNAAGGVVANPAANLAQIRYVRVRVSNYQMPLAIPFTNFTLTVPEVSSTLPAESLGVPYQGAAPAC